MTRKMKDSGIEWIGEIPEDWKITKFKRYSKSAMGNTILKTDLLDDQGKYSLPVYSATQEDVVFGYVGKDNVTVVLSKNDLVIPARGNSIGYVKVIPFEKATCTQTTIFSKLNDINVKFVYLCSIAFKDFWFEFDQTAIPQITVQQVENNYIPVCTIKEQTKIADFLTSKLSVINDIKLTIKDEIQTLEDYKKSLITEAVTKGLDKNVEMKDSGLEWIGEIPKHWNVTYLKSFFDEGKNKNKLGRETNLLSLSYGEIIKKDINTQTGLLPQNFNNYNIVEKGSIIIRPTDLQNDKKSLRTGLVNERGIITSAYINLKPKKNIVSKYFHYLLHCYDLMKVFYNMGSGVRQGLTYSEFSKLLVLSPNNLEQEQIISYLDSKTKVIDDAISTKQKQLETLEEYKKSLIYEYVTGKKEVL